MLNIALLKLVLAFSGEEIVSQVHCVIRDPGTLKNELNFNVGDSFKIETLNSNRSNILHRDTLLVTSFPAVLRFRSHAFRLQNSADVDSEEDFSLSASGKTNGQGFGYIRVRMNDGDIPYILGEAELENCVRLLPISQLKIIESHSQ